jgi:chromosome segregation ATPase
MLQIAGESDSALANASTLSNLLTTTPILEPALAAADISMAQWRRASGTITAQSTAPQLVTVIVTLSDDGKLPTGAAEKILGGVCEQAIAAVLAAWDRQDAALTSQLTPLLEKSEAAKAREEEAQKAVAELREKMDAQRNGGDRNRSVRESLLNEKRETERTLAADSARLKSMESVAPLQTADEVVGPLAKEAFQKADAVVEFRKKRLEELRELAKTGKATAEEVTSAEFAVADARLFSIAYTATLTGLKNLAGYIVQQPNDPRPELRATVAAMEAKLKVLNDQIAEVAEPKDQPPPVTQGQIERAQNTASNARRDYDTLMQQIERLRSQNRLGARPKIAVLGKDSSPASPLPPLPPNE